MRDYQPLRVQCKGAQVRLFMSIQDFLSNATKRKFKESEIAEADIESHFCKYAKRKRCNALKLIYLNKKGFPDRTVLCPGSRIFFIEFKRKDKPQSPLQVKVQILLESFGFEYYVCDEIGQAETILDSFLAFDE